MKKSKADQGKPQVKRQGGRSTLGMFEEPQGRQHVRAVPPSTTDTSHVRLLTSKFIKTKKKENTEFPRSHEPHFQREIATLCDTILDSADTARCHQHCHHRNSSDSPPLERNDN